MTLPNKNWKKGIAEDLKGDVLEMHILCEALTKITGVQPPRKHEGDTTATSVQHIVANMTPGRLPVGVRELRWHMRRLPVLGTVAGGGRAAMAELAKWCNDDTRWVVISETGLRPTESLMLVHCASNKNELVRVANLFATSTSPKFSILTETAGGRFYIVAPLAAFF